MRFVLTCGGTAGHINPALALAEELVQRGHEVFFAGTPRGLEARLIVEAGFPFKGFEASGFNRRHPLSLVKAFRKLKASADLVKPWLGELAPCAVVGFGAYVSIPVGRAALAGGIPLVVHEQNSIAGLANKYLGRRARAVALSYEYSRRYFPKGVNVVVTGNPVRSSVLAASREVGRERFDIPQDACMLLVFGGSLGAQNINAAVMRLRDRLLAHENLFVMHVAGRKDYEACRDYLALDALDEGLARRWRLYSYQDHMGEALAASDLVVSRAGASSLAEISALQIPAVLIPYPYATGDHQTINARASVERGAALLLADKDLHSESFAEALVSLIESPKAREDMRRAAASFEAGNAAARLADVVSLAAGL